MPFHFYLYWSYRLREGEAAFQMAAEKLAAALGEGAPPQATPAQDTRAPRALERSPEALLVLAEVVAHQIPFSVDLGHRDLARQLVRRSVAILERPELAGQDRRRARAWLLAHNGYIAAAEGAFEEYRRVTKQALALFRELDDPWMVAEELRFTGVAAQCLGAYDDAKRLMDEALAIRRELGDPMAVAESLRVLGYLALEQGQLEETERLRRESLAILRETGDRSAIAWGAMALGWADIWLGRFAEALTLARQSLQVWGDLGLRNQPAAAETYCLIGSAQLHLGRYERARANHQSALTIVRGYRPRFLFGRSRHELGAAALAEGAHGEAQGRLQACVAALQDAAWFWDRQTLGRALADLAVAERGLGRPARARQHLSEALTTIGASGGHGFHLPQARDALLASALLLADQGEATRAIELYVLAYQHPHVANSRWFEDVLGRQIAAVAETLAPEVVAAARERGAARDLEATVVELLAELA